MAKRRTKPVSGPLKPAAGRRAGTKRRPVKRSNRRSASTKSSSTVVENNGKVLAATSKPIPKTKFSEKELEEFKNLLLEKRRQLVGDVDSLASEALGKNRMAATGDLSMMPIHMADIGTDNYEQEFTIGLMENEQETLKEIDAALARIKDRTYGVCMATHKRILKARLRAKPWARYCLQYKLAEEQARRRESR